MFCLQLSKSSKVHHLQEKRNNHHPQGFADIQLLPQHSITRSDAIPFSIFFLPPRLGCSETNTAGWHWNCILYVKVLRGRTCLLWWIESCIAWIWFQSSIDSIVDPAVFLDLWVKIRAPCSTIFSVTIFWSTNINIYMYMSHICMIIVVLISNWTTWLIVGPWDRFPSIGH